MAGAVYNNFVQQPNQGGSFEEAFKKGYGLMDMVYQTQRKQQLTSKLAELYTADPNMDTMTRMRKTVPLLAMYGDSAKAIELEKALATQESAEAIKKQTLAQQLQAQADKLQWQEDTLKSRERENQLNRENALLIAGMRGKSGGDKKDKNDIVDYEDYQDRYSKLVSSIKPKDSKEVRRSKNSLIHALNQRAAQLGIIDQSVADAIAEKARRGGKEPLANDPAGIL